MAARAELQDLGARKMMRLFAGQRREAEEAMRRGELPDFPRQQAETEDQLRALLLLLYIGLADGTRFKNDGLRELGLVFAERRTREIAGRIVERSRKRTTDILADLDSRRARGLEVKSLDIRLALEGIYGPSRATTIATTETTNAHSAALEDVGKQKAEREQSVMVMLWRLRPCRHCTFCPLMHDMPQEVYGKYLSGPPAHPNCCCQLDLAFFDDQDKADKFIQRRIDRQPSESQVTEAARVSGVF